MSVGTLEEIIDDNHAIVSTSVGSEHYVSILSFVDKATKVRLVKAMVFPVVMYGY